MRENSVQPPEIPGYKLLRVLGKGGMATVYLAHQASVDREVALKYLSKHLLADERFAERFLREARIAAKLHHRHVVSIYDVGVHQDQPYIAMEYLSGGQIMVPEQSIDARVALQCVQEIALALDYAHSKGVIHRDVKPDNILLRDDGSCVLSDFGIARMIDGATMMTRTGAVVGTPYYMSPEQLRGKQVDGRADLYSLGVVFYQLLTGKVPYSASDSMAVGIMHMTAPLPRLPSHYQYLQPLLDKMLAKEVADRVRTGVELSDAAKALLRQVHDAEDQRITQPQTSVSAKNMEPKPSATRAEGSKPVEALPSTRRVEPVMRIEQAPSFTSGPAQERPMANRDGRAEPTMGSMQSARPGMKFEPAIGKIDASIGNVMRQQPRRQESGGMSRLLLPVLILAVLSGAGYFYREQIAALIEAPAVTTQKPSDLASRAELAEKQGTLFDGGDSDALSLFQQILAAEPNDARAKAGLDRVVSGLISQAQAALATQPARADAIIKRLQSFASDDPRVGTLAARLSKAPVASPASTVGTMVGAVSVDAELAAALESERASEWLGPNGALARYVRVLLLEPRNQKASAGIRAGVKAATALLDKAIKSGNEAAVDRIAREWAQAQPESAQRMAMLRQWQANLNDGAEEKVRIDTWLQQADVAFAAGQITSPPNQSAVDRWRAVLTLAPGNARAEAGLQHAGDELAQQAQSAIAQEQYSSAERLLAQAKSAAGDSAKIREVARALAAAQSENAPPPPVSVDLDARDAALAKIDLALENGQLLEPPGVSAFDQLRALERTVRDGETIKRSQRLSMQLRSVMEVSVDSGDFENAVNTLSGLRALGGQNDLTQLRNQLADSLIDDIRAKISIGELDGAKRRLGLLRTLHSKHPEIENLQLELVQAGG
jgi:serine/threonine-protein kinase PpkA